MIGSLNAKMSESVRRNGSAVAAVGGGDTIFGALSGEKCALRAHEPGDAVAPSWASEGSSQSWAPVGLTTARKLLPDALAQVNALQLPRSMPVATLFPIVITTARNQQHLA